MNTIYNHENNEMRKLVKLGVVFTGIIFGATALAAKNSTVENSIGESAVQISPLMNGQQVPDVITTQISGQEIELGDVLNNKKTVLFFYRGGWCPFCNTQMGQFKKIEADLKALGFQLIGISTDSPKALQESVKKHELDYTLLSDFHSTVSQAFGLAFFASEKTTERYLAKMDLKNPLKKNQAGEERLVLPVPAVYIIDSKGLVQFNYVNPNYKVRLHEALLLKAAELVK